MGAAGVGAHHVGATRAAVHCVIAWLDEQLVLHLRWTNAEGAGNSTATTTLAIAHSRTLHQERFRIAIVLSSPRRSHSEIEDRDLVLVARWVHGMDGPAGGRDFAEQQLADAEHGDLRARFRHPGISPGPRKCFLLV